MKNKINEIEGHNEQRYKRRTEMDMTNISKISIPTWEKLTLSVEEAAAYSGIGINRIREIMNEKDCDFVLRVGNRKSVIKRVKFEKYILAHEAI